MTKGKVFVAMSGGVDSSVAAALLKERGHDVVGVHLKCYNVDGCGEREAEDARRVAEQLAIPFYVFDMEKEYKQRVVEYLIDGYQQGITPNPDVMCNKEIKFGLFLQRALELGADYIATGHYVRLTQHLAHYSVENIAQAEMLGPEPESRAWRGTKEKDFGRALRPSFPREKAEAGSHRNSGRDVVYSLMIGKDKNKDQSYFLWTLTQAQLKHCLFPIGEYTKPQVRKLAKKFGLLTANKKDSQGICFLGDIVMSDFLKTRIPEKRGVVLSIAGEEIGSHRGAHTYTIGQRHGFIVGDQRPASQAKRGEPETRFASKARRARDQDDMRPHYVVTKDVKNNTLTVAEGNDNPALYKKEITLINVNFINSKIDPPAGGCKLKINVRVRYRQPLSTATLFKVSAPFGKLRVKLVFDEFQKFVAPGQSAVFYDKKGVLLGGGVII